MPNPNNYTAEHLAMARQWQRLVDEWKQSRIAGNRIPFDEHRNAAEIRRLNQELNTAFGIDEDADLVNYQPTVLDGLLALVADEATEEAAAQVTPPTPRDTRRNQWESRDPDSEFIAYIQTLPIGGELPPRIQLEHFGNQATLTRRLQRLSHPVTGWLTKTGHGKFIRRR
jgi:hypothetical protein